MNSFVQRVAIQNPTELDPVHVDLGYAKRRDELSSFIQIATGTEISSFPSFIQDHLNMLARTAMLLGLDEPTRLAYTKSLSNLSADKLQLQLHLIQLQRIEKELQDALDLARQRLSLTDSWDTYAEGTTPDTASLERQKKFLSAKAKDYQRELSTITSETYPESDGEQSMTSIISRQERLRSRERELKLLKGRLKAFEGLPPNLELAQVELANAREHQLRLLNTREKLLGRMAQGLS